MGQSTRTIAFSGRLCLGFGPMKGVRPLAIARNRVPRAKHEKSFLEIAKDHRAQLDKETERYAKRVARVLKARRLELDLDLKELAFAAGISDETVRQIEAGKISPTLKTAYRLARALRLPMEQLAGNEPGIPVRNGDQRPTDPQQRALNVAGLAGLAR